jgi:hypothetical protein
MTGSRLEINDSLNAGPANLAVSGNMDENMASEQDYSDESGHDYTDEDESDYSDEIEQEDGRESESPVTRIHASVCETQQDVAALSAEISSLRQAQLALCQRLNHDRSVFQTKVEALRKVFKEELQAASKLAQKEARRAIRAEMLLLLRQSSCAPRFPQFSRLPVEIRCMIWNFAIPCGIVHLVEHRLTAIDAGWCVWSCKQKQTPPAITQVCREARTVACRTGALVPLKCPSKNEFEWPSSFAIEWTWFDPTRDTLFFSFYSHQGGGGMCFSNLEDSLYTQARYITLECGQNVWNHLDELFYPAQFPHIRRVQFVRYRHVLKEKTDLMFESLVFGSSKGPIFVDIDEPEEFLGKLRSHSTSRLINQFELELEGNLTGSDWPSSSDLNSPSVVWPEFLDLLQRELRLWSRIELRTPISKHMSFHRVIMLTMERRAGQ